MSTGLYHAITDSLIAAIHASKIGASFSTASLGFLEGSRAVAKKDLYKAMLKRMESAIESEFYMEACWIQYAILEDRLNSVIRHTYPKKGEKFLAGFRGFDRKLNHIIEKIHPDSEVCTKTVHKPLLESMRKWKDKRNNLMHEISDSVEYEAVYAQAKKIALEGVKYVNDLGNRVRKYKEAVKKQAKSKET